MFENGPIVRVVYVNLVAVVVRMFVVLSQFLNRKAQAPRLLVVQFHTVIQTLAIGPPGAPACPLAIVRSKVQVPD